MAISASISGRKSSSWDYDDEETELDLETEEVFDADAPIDDLGDDDDF